MRRKKHLLVLIATKSTELELFNRHFDPYSGDNLDRNQGQKDDKIHSHKYLSRKLAALFGGC